MPKLSRRTQESNETPEQLRPFVFHGMDLQKGSGKEWSGECPFCQSEGKFSVNEKTSLWQCWKTDCGRKGNSSEFLKQIHEASFNNTSLSDYEWLSRNRSNIKPDTLMRWGLCRSVITGYWMAPSHNENGVLNQLYIWKNIRSKKTGELKRTLLPTSTMGLGMFSAEGKIGKQPEVWLCEGVWDCMALYDGLQKLKVDENGDYSLSSGSSALKDIQVLGISGTKVLKDKWAKKLAGKSVTIWFDNDEAGAAGASHTSKILVVNGVDPDDISCMSWGDRNRGFTKSLPNGSDLRDFLSVVVK